MYGIPADEMRIFQREANREEFLAGHLAECEDCGGPAGCLGDLGEPLCHDCSRTTECRHCAEIAPCQENGLCDDCTRAFERSMDSRDDR